MNKLITALLVAITLIAGGILVVSLRPETPQDVNVTIDPNSITLKGDAEFARTGRSMQTASSTVSTNATGTEIAVASSSIAYRRIQNVGPNLIMCVFEQARATNTKMTWGVGIVLTTSGTDSIFEQYAGNWGYVRCMASTTAGRVSIVQY